MIEEHSANMLNQVQDLGYETQNSLLNLETISIFLNLWVFKLVVVLPLLFIFSYVTNKWYGVYKYIMRRMMFSEILMLLFESYLTLLIAAYLQLRSFDPLTITSGDKAALGYGWLCLVVTLLIMPALNYSVLKGVSPEKLSKRKYNRKWGEFWRSLKLQPGPLMYYPVFMFRRLVLVTVSFELSVFPA